MEFTIDPPDRLKFDEWQVSVKSLISLSRIMNIYDGTQQKWTFDSIDSVSHVNP